jgi:hypothetical protein
MKNAIVASLYKYLRTFYVFSFYLIKLFNSEGNQAPILTLWLDQANSDNFF